MTIPFTLSIPYPPSKLNPNRQSLKWSQDEDKKLKALHVDNSIAEISQAMGRSKASIRGRISRLGISRQNLWSSEDISILTTAYHAAGDNAPLDLVSLSSRLGRHKSNVCRKARELGLGTSLTRRKVDTPKKRLAKFVTKADRSKATSARIKKWHEENEHPRGMAGKQHSEETKKLISQTSSARWASMTDDEKSNHTLVALKAKAKKGPIAHKSARGSWKAGWRSVGGQDIYFRSRWEANYGLYLQWLKERGVISDWCHEPETFWFDAIKRGVRSYLPDFFVWEVNGQRNIHEVKGWMDARSKTTLRRMAKYYPNENIILISSKEYRKIQKAVSAIIPGWEQ